MAYEKDKKRPGRGRRTLGLIVASTVATAPSFGCDDSANPARDAGAMMTAMDGATPSDAAPIDAAAATDTAVAVDTAVAMDTGSQVDSTAASDGTRDGGDAMGAGDAGQEYPPGIRG